MQRPYRPGYYPGQKTYANFSEAQTPTPVTTRPARFTGGLLLIGAILLMLVLAACGDEGPTSISKAEMAADVQNNNAVRAGTVFKPTDPYYQGRRSLETWLFLPREVRVFNYHQS